MKTYELTTLNHLPKSYWLLSRAEQDRFRDIILKWRKSNKDCSVFDEIVAEETVRLHLLCQRCVSQAQFFNGETTDYRYVREEHKGDLTTEDARRKSAEFDKYYFQLVKMKAEYLKIALANNINIDVNGDLMSVVAALDKVGSKQDASHEGAETTRY